MYATGAVPPILYSVSAVARARPAARDFVTFLQGKEASAAAFTKAGSSSCRKE